MASVFSNVQAEIADDLINRFPQEFDFDAMLRKVCEDAGVAIDPIVKRAENGVDHSQETHEKPAKYKLKGLWLAMEKAYKHLVTTLALYGTRIPDTLTELPNSHVDTSGYNHDIAEEPAGINEDESDKDYQPHVRNILQDIFKDNKRQRRPRKSPRQSRKVIGEWAKLSFDNDDLGESVSKPAVDPTTDDSLEKGNGYDDEDGDGDNALEGENDVNGDELDPESKEAEEAKPRKRGRPRKNSAPFHLTNKQQEMKKRGPYKKRRVITPNSSVNSGEVPVARRRGRPKMYNDEEKSEFSCSDCGFIAKKRAKLRSHRLRMHLASPTKCDLCNKVFPNKRYMLRHRASHVAPQHCCDVCGKMYKIRKAMLEHRKTHDTNFKKTKVKCEMCPKSFCNRYILECHVRDIHMGQKKSYLCSTCGKSFTTKHSLAEHTNAHTGVKPHVCEHCGKSFSYESALRDHRYTHIDAKHFWCHHCQKGFSQRSGLKMHMRIHRQHKMFNCTECGRGFTQKQALQRHERVHKGEKPFVCKHCGRFFTDASIIRRHLILVHKIHKDANHWREDIVCTVKAQNEYQVQKAGEENSLSDVEKEKDELLKVVGAQPRSNLKGPSRAFSRTYPRRVALLDEEGNVIAPPELPPRPPIQRSKSSESGSSTGPSKSLGANANTTLILATENSSDLDSSSQVLSQRYGEGTQWDALTGQLGRGSSSQIEHMILDDTAQHEIQRGIEHVHGLHKIIKYENLQPGNVQSSTHILSHSQSSQSPSSSPISFASQATSHSRVLEASFETINPQAAHTGSQYYDGRTNSHASAPWPSMLYYSQLASQFGMNINTEYPYVGGTVTSSPASTHLTQYTTHSPSSHQAMPTTIILQPQTFLSHIDSSKPDELHGLPNSSGQSLLNPSLHQSSQDLVRHVAGGLKLSPNDSLHTTELILQTELQNSPTPDVHHVNLDHMTSALGDVQSIIVHHVSDSRQSSPGIPPQNSALLNLKHK